MVKYNNNPLEILRKNNGNINFLINCLLNTDSSHYDITNTILS